MSDRFNQLVEKVAQSGLHEVELRKNLEICHARIRSMGNYDVKFYLFHLELEEECNRLRQENLQNDDDINLLNKKVVVLTQERDDSRSEIQILKSAASDLNFTLKVTHKRL